MEINANEPMHLTAMPSALLSCRLLSQALRQKQVRTGVIGDASEVI